MPLRPILFCLSFALVTVQTLGGLWAQETTQAYLQRPPQELLTGRAGVSLDMESHFLRRQTSRIAQGLMRTDDGGRLTRAHTEDIISNFVRIALFTEYSGSLRRAHNQRSASLLRRWERPVRMSVTFGQSIPLEQRAEDQRTVREYARRLSRATGHSIHTAPPQHANFHILFVNENERVGALGLLRELLPDISDRNLRQLVSMNRHVNCQVFTFWNPNSESDQSYYNAVSIIRGELPPLARKSCIHEELAQGLGLPNDSPDAFPSIFNDDEEFALLTRHDELLLKILYDERLRPGMSAPEAEPIVQTIVAELLPH
ncbi:DUF2927 domain-containing protein [Cochlodiniinecator piscidefendens]|uniref:DUF2927 domain-containing protein n=1 Tax=Cochlodiniinecator piscidefendens TaxID=2715756 RepID=UPI00140AB13C|nr:DUF2927 domain-containing protein [Cochlodiniinecator piscidefendens]